MWWASQSYTGFEFRASLNPCKPTTFCKLQNNLKFFTEFTRCPGIQFYLYKVRNILVSKNYYPLYFATEFKKSAFEGFSWIILLSNKCSKNWTAK